MTSNPSSHGVFQNWNIASNDHSDNTQYCVIHGYGNHSTKECHAFPKKATVATLSSTVYFLCLLPREVQLLGMITLPL